MNWWLVLGLWFLGGLCVCLLFCAMVKFSGSDKPWPGLFGKRKVPVEEEIIEEPRKFAARR